MAGIEKASLAGYQAVAEARLEQLQNAPGVRASGGKKAPDQKEIDKAATQFEGLLLQQMFKSMWQSIPDGGMLTGSREEEWFRDMLNEALANEVASKQSLGLKDIVAKELERRSKGEKQ